MQLGTTGLFATTAINSAVTRQGLFVGGGVGLLGTQVIAIAAVLAYSFVMTSILL